MHYDNMKIHMFECFYQDQWSRSSSDFYLSSLFPKQNCVQHLGGRFVKKKRKPSSGQTKLRWPRPFYGVGIWLTGVLFTVITDYTAGSTGDPAVADGVPQCS